jgi:hypothetical protein
MIQISLTEEKARELLEVMEVMEDSDDSGSCGRVAADINRQLETPTENITIARQRFNNLCDANEKLDALQAAGVDNWSGYSYAMEIMDGANE